MARVYIGIGSNEGDRLAQVSNAISRLGRIQETRVRQMALVIETQPVGGPPQDAYLNTVVELETTVPPRELVGALKSIERDMGRVESSVRWGPRPIDLDLLWYDQQVIDEPGLTVPHPRMHERRFVLEPLAQLAPDLVHPVLHCSVRALLERLDRTMASQQPVSGPG